MNIMTALVFGKTRFFSGASVAVLEHALRREFWLFQPQEIQAGRCSNRGFLDLKAPEFAFRGLG